MVEGGRIAGNLGADGLITTKEQMMEGGKGGEKEWHDFARLDFLLFYITPRSRSRTRRR